MGLLTLLGVRNGAESATTDRTDSDSDSPPDRELQCRNCGRYYPAGGQVCPHCGSGNQIRDGAPPQATARH